jgi:hypothetical protein
MKTFLFVARKVFAWTMVCAFVLVIWATVLGGRGHVGVLLVIMGAGLAAVAVFAFSHANRVRLIAEAPDSSMLASRHRRRIEIPLPSAEAFTMVDAAIRELPYVYSVESARDSLQVFARVKRKDDRYMGKRVAGLLGTGNAAGASGARRNQILATLKPGEATTSLTLICEPEAGAWMDWFMVDDGTNLENIEAITRAVTRRIAERRKGEEKVVRDSATDKELAVAKLNLLHAQVEPHFLYNTLASAQVLTRSDPDKAHSMLGNLIGYLRTSIPRTEDAPSTLGEELQRAESYLGILRIRMGERLEVQVQVPEALKRTPLPPMMLQTLVENAIKHGLEPEPGGGRIWIIAREEGERVALTVADDGRGFSEDGGGTGIGLRNVRERLRLAYGDAAAFSIVANFPKGVAATITVPREFTPAPGGKP